MKLDPLGFKDIHPHSYRQGPTLKDNYRFTFFPKVSYSLECPASLHTNPSHLGAGAGVMEWITSWTINPGVA